MENKHTKGVLRGEVNINDLGAKNPRYTLGIGTKVLFHTSFYNSRRNANRMMKCWNSHDALLEACKEMKSILVGMNFQPYSKAMKKAKAAIAAAESEA